MKKNKRLEVAIEMLNKLPRDQMREFNRSIGVNCGHQKKDTVKNLANYMVSK